MKSTKSSSPGRILRLLPFTLVALHLVGFAGDRHGTAIACLCSSPAHSLEALSGAGAVFAGVVVSREPPPPRPNERVWSGDPITYSFHVTHAWKGVVKDTVSVVTTRAGIGCGYEFILGEWFLVYAELRDDQLHTSSCTRTSPVEEALVDLYELPAPTRADPARPLPVVTIPVLAALIEDPDQRTRRQAAIALGSLATNHDRTVAVLIGMLGHDDYVDRAVACMALGRIGSDARVAIPELVSLFNDKQEVVRARAMEALSRIGEQSDVAVPALTKALASRYEEVRREALMSLGRFGNDAAPAIESIVVCLDDQKRRVRLAALSTLKSIGEPPDVVIFSIIRLLQEGDHRDRHMAAWTLGEMGARADSAIPALTEAANEDGDESVRGCASRALDKIRGDD